MTGTAGSGTFSYSYDGLSRITGANLSGISQSYAYDLDGNRVEKVDAGVTTSYVFDRSDQLVSQAIDGGTAVSFAYSAYGNLTTGPDAANAITTYAYDLADRLTSIDPPTETATSFTFDALGRHATRVTPSGTDTYGYVGASETVWQVANASLTINSAIDAAGNRTGVKPGGVVGLTLPDLHGSVAAELGQNASSILSALRYDTYGLLAPGGGTWDSGGSFTNPWRYQGRLDLSPAADNPRYDAGARDYLPGAGVFASLDSYAGAAADPRSMNRFLYALANPATLIDPDGHMATTDDSGYIAEPTGDPDTHQAWEANKQQARADEQRHIDAINTTACQRTGVCEPEWGGEEGPWTASAPQPTQDCGFLGLGCPFGPGVRCGIVSTPYGQELQCSRPDGWVETDEDWLSGFPGEVNETGLSLTQSDIDRIVQHALERAAEGSVGRLPAELQDEEELASYIWDLVNNETYERSKQDGKGRIIYEDDDGIVVIFDPNGPGSVFKPDKDDYYDRWPKVGPGPGG